MKKHKIKGDPCCAKIRTPDGFGSVDCSRMGTVVRNGNWFCWQHDPVKLEKEQKEREAEWAREWKEDVRKRNRLEAMQKACKGVPTTLLMRMRVADIEETAKAVRIHRKQLHNRLKEITRIIECVKERATRPDGYEAPIHLEIQKDEMIQIYKLAKGE